MTGWIVRPYDWVVSGLLMRGTYAKIADSLTVGVPDGGRVLDVGTGPGRLTAMIAARRPGLMVTGIDPSADMLARAHRRIADLPNAEVVLAGAEDLPFDDHTFDAVVSTLSSHHWADLAGALAQQTRVLRPGGRLWVIDLRRHAPTGLADSVAAAGLQLSDPSQDGPNLIKKLIVVTARRPLEAG